MSDIERLRACPFCGERPGVTILHYRNPESYRFQVGCDCGADGSEEAAEVEAIAAWNTRAPDPRIAELETEVGRLRALQWMPDEFGRPERALYLGGIFVGYVQELKPVRATWRAWLMVDLDGSDAGERDTEIEAKDLLLRAARAALENKP